MTVAFAEDTLDTLVRLTNAPENILSQEKHLSKKNNIESRLLAKEITSQKIILKNSVTA